jgi:hypothetical protein
MSPPPLTCTGKANVERAEDGLSQWSSRFHLDRSEEEAELLANIHRHYRGDPRDQPHCLSVVYPDCRDEDQNALHELLATIRGRRQSGMEV